MDRKLVDFARHRIADILTETQYGDKRGLIKRTWQGLTGKRTKEIKGLQDIIERTGAGMGDIDAERASVGLKEALSKSEKHQHAVRRNIGIAGGVAGGGLAGTLLLKKKKEGLPK